MFERRRAIVDLAKGWRGAAASAKAGAAPGAPAKKGIDVEALLRWVYLEELPKEGARCSVAPAGNVSGWGGVEKFGEYLALIDDADLNRWGVVPETFADRAPHADAIAVVRSVAALDAMELGLPDDWSPFGDFGDLGALGEAAVAATIDRLTAPGADGSRRLRTSPSFLLRKFAILGGCPCWEGERPTPMFERGANGRAKWFVRRVVTCGLSGAPMEIEVDGWSSVQQRPAAGAYRKQFLDPDPVDVGIERGEYEIWRAALDMLVEDLAGALSEHEALPSPRAYRPWESGETVGSVWPDLTVARVDARANARGRRGRRKRIA